MTEAQERVDEWQKRLKEIEDKIIGDYGDEIEVRSLKTDYDVLTKEIYRYLIKGFPGHLKKILNKLKEVFGAVAVMAKEKEDTDYFNYHYHLGRLQTMIDIVNYGCHQNISQLFVDFIDKDEHYIEILFYLCVRKRMRFDDLRKILSIEKKSLEKCSLALEKMNLIKQFEIKNILWLAIHNSGRLALAKYLQIKR